jgi:Fe-S oxidoreductase
MSFDRMLAGARAGRILEENSGTVVTYCPFCYLNLSRAGESRVIDMYVLLARGGLNG